MGSGSHHKRSDRSACFGAPWMEGDLMRRLIFVIIGALAFTLLTGTAASARGDGWEFLDQSDFTAAACGTEIDWSIVTNREFAKFAVDAGGVLHFVLVTGALKIRVTNTATDASVLVNASGTGHDALLYPNGDFLLTSAGPSLILLTPEQAAETGLPELFLASGNMSILFRAAGSAELQGRLGHLTDLCAVLT